MTTLHEGRYSLANEEKRRSYRDRFGRFQSTLGNRCTAVFHQEKLGNNWHWYHRQHRHSLSRILEKNKKVGIIRIRLGVDELDFEITMLSDIVDILKLLQTKQRLPCSRFL